jgi:hypothetical protein
LQESIAPLGTNTNNSVFRYLLKLEQGGACEVLSQDVTKPTCRFFFGRAMRKEVKSAKSGMCYKLEPEMFAPFMDVENQLMSVRLIDPGDVPAFKHLMQISYDGFNFRSG